MNIEDVRIAASKANAWTDKGLIWLTVLPAPLTLVVIVVILTLAAYAGHVL